MESFAARWLGESAYALGLWCADGYWWSSSIGLSNCDPSLILRFAQVLKREAGTDRLRVRIYAEPHWDVDQRIEALGRATRCRPKKMRIPAYHVYVNSRPLLREYRAAEGRILDLHPSAASPYFAGRFDGDGALGSGRVPGIRIAYSNEQEAALDAMYLRDAGITRLSVLRYARAAEYVLYVQKPDLDAFLGLITPYSSRLAAQTKGGIPKDASKKPVPRKPHSEDVKAGEPSI